MPTDMEPGDLTRPAAGVVARDLLRAQLEAFSALLPAVRMGSDAEALHDLRVAMRRGRTVLGQLRDVFPGDDAARLRAELARLTRVSGPVRDLDVYLERLPGHARALPAGLRAELEPLRGFAQMRREPARAQLLRELDEPSIGALLDLWRLVAGSAGAARSVPGTTAVVVRRIEQHYEKLVTRSDRLDARVSAARLHRLRKRGKKLRYLLELFAQLRPADDCEAAVRRLRDLQDALGCHHDLHVHAALTLQLGEQAAATGNTGPRALLAAGAVAQVMYRKARRRKGVCVRALQRMGRGKARRQLAGLGDGWTGVRQAAEQGRSGHSS